jgi:hypothetical protein
MEWWIALTAADCGLLLGASDQSVYKRRKSSSARRALPAIAALRTLTRRSSL